MRRDPAVALNVAAALNMLNARRPFARRSAASVPCFLAGWPTSELPLQTLAAHAALNVAAYAAGGNRGRAAALDLALSGLTAAGLAGIYRVAKSTGEAYEQALVDALGAGFDVAHPDRPGPDPATARTPGVARMARIRRRFAHHADVRYGPARHANRLDIWKREDLPADAHAPVLVQVPGGAWVSGNKQAQAYPLMSHLAELGWICVAISYRLGPRHVWPSQIVDVKRALAWVRRNIAGYGGDPGFVAVTGGSAGGHLSSLAALTPNDPQWQPGFEDVDTSVVAAAPFYGAYDWLDRDGTGHHDLVPFVERWVAHTSRDGDRELFDRASPMSRVNADAPPFLVSHGTNDSLIPVEQARAFARRLGAVSRAPVVWAEVPGAQHAYDVFGSTRANQTAVAVGRFLGHVYARYRAEGA